MSLRKLLLPAIALLLIPAGMVKAQQQQQAPPARPGAPDAPSEFTFFLNGGSFLGIYTEEVTRENMSRYNLREPRGVVISKVVEGSPAEKAGLRKDDVVLRFNGEEVTSVRKLSRQISEVAPDHAARLTISRGGSEQEISVTIGKRNNDYTTALTLPRMEGDAGKALENLYGQSPQAFTFALGARRRIGVGTTTLTKQLADYFSISGGQGVLITSVTEGSPADKAGLKAGDVITQVDGEQIEGAGDLSRAINRKQEGDITLVIVRDKSQRTISVTPEKSDSMQYFTPGLQTLPRIGQLGMPRIIAAPRLDRIKMNLPRIQAMPRIRALIGGQPL